MRHLFRALLSVVPLTLALLCGAVRAQGWVDVTPAALGPVGAGAMSFDPVRGVTWFFGNAGYVSSWNGLSWATQLTVGGPALAPVLSFWSPATQRVVAAAPDYSGPAMLHFFEWDGASWVSVSGFQVPSPISSGYVCAAFDRLRSEIVCVSAVSAAGQSSLTRVFDGQGWVVKNPAVSPPAPTTHAQMFFDTSSGRVVLVDLSMAQTIALYWEWTGANWIQRFPQALPPTRLGQVAVDENSGVALAVFTPSPIAQPRALNIIGGQVEELFPSVWPAMRIYHHLVHDSVRDVFVLHGGQSAFNGSPFADTWELQLGPNASYTTSGAGCMSSGGMPTIAPQSGDLPYVNSIFNLQVSGMPWTGPAFMWVGFSNQFYGSVPLPANLAILGAPQCNLLISPDVLMAIPNVLGTSVWSLPIPATPGLSFYNQAVVFDPVANPLGLVLSNAGYAVTGQ